MCYGFRKIDKRGDLRDAVFHYEQVAESDAGVIEITHARPAKEDKPKAQADFRRLLLEGPGGKPAREREWLFLQDFVVPLPEEVSRPGT